MIGSEIGPYRVLELIGEGGFGSVYLAERREPYDQRVALKVIKAGMDSKAVVARFEAERQALAVMDHPMIARVLDGGVTEPDLGSRPYFVMELVRGEPITDFCDKNRLTIDERCELMADVCQAVQHAHTKGVVHRDLKPSNILVGYDADGHASPRVIDFGVAKALNTRLSDQTILTERGQMIGTPEYMSPEQAEMSGVDIDTRSDVYSLGVVLYELLTGVRPFDLKMVAIAEMQRVLREEEPPKPSTRVSKAGHDPRTGSRILESRQSDARTLTSRLRHDLDWVVMRCLEKDRDRRYDTAEALASELDRYLSDVPVLAGRPGLTHRLAKYVRRHRLAVGITSVIALVVIVSLWVTTSALISERRALWWRDRSQVFMSTVFGFASPDALGRDATAVQMLRAAEEEVDQFSGADEVLRAVILASLASAYERVGDPERALVLIESAVPVLERELGERDAFTLDAHKTLGVVLVQTGEFEKALALIERTLEHAKAVRSPSDELVLRLTRDFAIASRRMGDLEAAEASYRSLITGFSQADGERSMFALRTRADLISVLIDLGKSAEAVLEAGRVFELAEGTEFGRAGMQMTRLYSNAAGAARAAGDLELALEWYLEAVDRARSVLGLEHPGSAVIYANCSGLLVQTGEPDRAIGLLDEIVGAYESESTSSRHRFAWLLSLRAHAHAEAGGNPKQDAARVIELVNAHGRDAYSDTQRSHIDRAIELAGE